MPQRFIRWWHRKRIQAAATADSQSITDAIRILEYARALVLCEEENGSWCQLYHAASYLGQQLEDAVRHASGEDWEL